MCVYTCLDGQHGLNFPLVKTETFDASFFISTARDVTLQQEEMSQRAWVTPQQVDAEDKVSHGLMATCPVREGFTESCGKGDWGWEDGGQHNFPFSLNPSWGQQLFHPEITGENVLDSFLQGFCSFAPRI